MEIIPVITLPQHAWEHAKEQRKLAETPAEETVARDFIAWAVNPQTPALSLTAPHNGQPATAGNGTMVALAADTPATVDAVYRNAIELGGTCEGPSGPRGESFYAGYFRDLEGNKLNVFCMMEPS